MRDKYALNLRHNKLVLADAELVQIVDGSAAKETYISFAICYLFALLAQES